MTLEAPPERRRRATSRDVALKREALAVVRALHPEIARVQQRAALLCSLSQSSLRSTHDLPALLAEVEALQAAVRAHSTALADRMSRLPGEVRNHSRVVDTVKALESVYQVLDRTRDRLLSDVEDAPRHLARLAMPLRPHEFVGVQR